MTDTFYYRPVPARLTGRWSLAGGWTRFSQIELLQRGRPPRIVEDAPDAVMVALTAPRAPILGLSLDRPRLMGIVNATPDSFSDGGAYDPARQALALIEEGAEILDIGGESTRPGAAEMPPTEELGRILPAIAAARGRAPISVDTRKAGVAQTALAAGAGMINDVSGFDFDPDLPAVVAGAGVPVCLMHAQGLPETMQDDPRYDDVLLDVYDALEARIRRAVQAGIRRDHIVIDPGIGFGKTQAHNLAILRRISLFHALGCPILLGVSRKRFIGSIGGAGIAADRGPGTLALTIEALAQGIQIHRVHDVGMIWQGLRLWAAVNENGAEQE
ncbi:MAG: dihydropteroate synthase [Paracoccus sp. (in: a-proteobacteria)]